MTEQHDHGDHSRPGNHWWLMIACCAPMLLIAIVLVTTGALSPWILVVAIVIVAFITLTMSRTHGGDQRQ